MHCAIVIIVFNLDKFLRKQIHLYRKCYKKADIFVVDNSTDKVMSERIKALCWDVGYIKTQAVDKDPSLSHSFAANSAYSTLVEQYDYMMWTDHDIFPLKGFNVKEMMKHKVIAGLPQVRKGIKYLWGGLVMINNKKIDKASVNFYPCKINGTQLDTGGSLHYILKVLNEGEYIYFDEVYKENIYFKGKDNSYSLLMDGTFMHFRNASNWMHSPDNEKRLHNLLSILKDYEDGNISS